MPRPSSHLLSAVLSLAGLVTAQVTAIPGTGCPGYTPTPVLGSPTVGGFITVQHAMSCTGGPITYPAVVAIGVTQTSTPFLACLSPTPCVIGVVPFHLEIGLGSVSWQYSIPNLPALSGACFLAQSTCIFSPPDCIVRMHQAVRICIQ